MITLCNWDDISVLRRIILILVVISRNYPSKLNCDVIYIGHVDAKWIESLPTDLSTLMHLPRWYALLSVIFLGFSVRKMDSISESEVSKFRHIRKSIIFHMDLCFGTLKVKRSSTVFRFSWAMDFIVGYWKC